MRRPASLITIAKDAAFLLLLFATLATVVGFVLPDMRQAEHEAQAAQQVDEQRAVIRHEVDSQVAMIEALQAQLAADGVPEAAVKRAALAGITKHRFGASNYGYFYVMDKDGVMLRHPIFPELVGRNIRDIVSPGGDDMGKLFGTLLSRWNEGYLVYDWQLPDRSSVERKTTYVRRMHPWGWVVAAGFYPSDLKPTLAAMSAATDAPLALARNRLALILAALGLAMGLTTWRVALRMRQTERELSRRVLLLERYQTLLDASSLVARTDPDGTITYVNDRFCSTTGHSRGYAIGRSHNIERHPDTPLAVFKDLWDTIKRGEVWQGILKNRKADGSSYFKQATIVPIKDEQGEIVEYISSGQDVTELFNRRSELERVFMTDQLTGLGSRTKLLQDLEAAAAPAVALLNIDGFGELNRRFGQPGGDAVLRQFSAELIGRIDTAAVGAYRIHADTFALLSPQLAAQEFEELMRGVFGSLEGMRVQWGGDSVPLVSRLGLAAHGHDSLAYAEQALALAKQTKLGFYACRGDDCGCTDETADQVGMLKTIQWALDNDRVYPIYQPIMRIVDGSISKFECLIRADGEDGQLLLPGQFIDVSKKTRRYQALTLRVIEKAVAHFSERPGYEFSINMTLEDLLNPQTVAFLVGTAHRAGLTRRMVVEIVETEELEDFGQANRVLDELKSLGIRVAIDDFGSGYSSFKYLLKLNPTYVKIDGSIVGTLLSDDRARQLVRSVVGFARDAGMETVAEFVNSQELLAELGALGVDYAQGWLVGKGERTTPEA